MIYYKAVRPNGTDFHSGTVRWLPEDLNIPDVGWRVFHPHPAKDISHRDCSASGYLSLAEIPTECTGMRWPCRLLVVEAGNDVARDHVYPFKVRVKTARVIAELPSHVALGPQGASLARLIWRVGDLTLSDVARMYPPELVYSETGAARSARYSAGLESTKMIIKKSRDAAGRAVDEAILSSMHRAAELCHSPLIWDVEEIIKSTARALMVRDLISSRDYDALTDTWRRTIGRLHPEDDGPAERDLEREEAR